MASVIEIPNMRHGYATILDLVRIGGRVVAPRGMKTYEVLNPTIILYDPQDSLPLGVGRKLNLDIAAVEAVQLCGGFADDALPVAASHLFEQFREDSGRFHGAYGRRIGTQTGEVVRKLRADPDSRQAVITLWDPKLDNLEGKRDYPCTVSFQFLVRDDKLQLTVNMRSNDAWLGVAYDIFQFSQLQWTVANMLGIGVGPLTHRPVSLHLYDRDLDKAEEVSVNSSAPRSEFRGFGSVLRAFDVGHGNRPTNATPTENWFADRLEPLIKKLDGDV